MIAISTAIGSLTFTPTFNEIDGIQIVESAAQAETANYIGIDDYYFPYDISISDAKNKAKLRAERSVF